MVTTPVGRIITIVLLLGWVLFDMNNAMTDPIRYQALFSDISGYLAMLDLLCLFAVALLLFFII